jgi:ribosomal protein S18 acetylase RimI-like enzyme
MTTIDRQTVTFRAVREDDTDFLFRLYCSTRQEEMQTVPWTEEMKEQFLRMQFTAQTAYYDEQFDRDRFSIIEQDARPIGRLYVHRDSEDIHIIDIAFLPESRGGGLGTALLREILDEAASVGLTVSIYVEHFNPAKHLYHRLGFKEDGENGVYHRMLWRAPANAPT